jgi:hypothetical protein
MLLGSRVFADIIIRSLEVRRCKGGFPSRAFGGIIGLLTT